MEVLDYLKDTITTCLKILRWGAGIQGNARKALVSDLQTICSNCEDAYGTILKHLVPVKRAYGNPTVLARELHELVGKNEIRDQFKPEHLCGRIDQLIQELASKLHPLRYAVDFRQVKKMRTQFDSFGSYDSAIYRAYDNLMDELDRTAIEIGNPRLDARERADHAQALVEQFQKELQSALDTVRQAKSELVKIM